MVIGDPRFVILIWFMEDPIGAMEFLADTMVKAIQLMKKEELNQRDYEELSDYWGE